ncbi:MAG TPA: SDR family oxidoreductase [Mycobacteriales bacterium]|nr:SDR family oxidoreductase [Mycobacteriales bacterium]
MRIVIAGGHGQIALLLSRRLSDRGDSVVGLIRNPAHAAEVLAAGAEPVTADLEAVDAATLAGHLTGADAVVFAAGAGPGSGAARKDTVDRAAAALLADAAERAGVRRHLQVSAMGVDDAPAGDDVFAVYLRAKAAAEADLRARDLDWTILRPGGLTDDPATGTVRLGPHVEPGRVPRDDVAAVLVALLDEPRTAGRTLELVGGETPIGTAVAEIG